MTEKDQRRASVLNRVLGGELAVGGAAELLRLSERQTKRLLAAYREEGVASLPHGNRGREPRNKLDGETRAKAVELASGRYAGLNHTHLAEKLREEEGLGVSRSTVRRVLAGEGMRSPRRRRAPKHRSRRERYCQGGMLVQMDASPHAWLGDRGPKLALLAAIDDATGLVPGALFRPAEDAAGYIGLMRLVVGEYGRPLAVYHDRHGIFRRQPASWTPEERLAGEPAPTQFGRLLGELGVESIAARSPRAKGRVERLFGTLQDRLVSELRLAGADTLGDADRVLREYLPRHNARFAVPADVGGDVWRPLAPGTDPETLFCLKYERTVGLDNTVRLDEHRLQLLPGPQRRSWAKAKVEVPGTRGGGCGLDGSIAVYHRGEHVAARPAPAEAPLIRARAGRLRARATALAAPPTPPPAPPAVPRPTATRGERLARHPKPAHDHPWRRYKERPGDNVAEQLE